MNPSEQELPYTRDIRSNAEDVALIRRMCDADETALGALYDRWMRSLHSLVVHLLKDPDEAEDVVEETFWQAWRKASSYEPSRGAVSTWLLTIGRRRALDRLRAKARRREDSLTREGWVLAEMPSNAPDPLQTTEGAERRRHVLAALRELPEEQREVLELGYFKGLTQPEIAEATGQPLGTVKTRMRLAMQKLREPLSMYRESAP
ncbi:MAG TPA: sigma-70 family RNA polymerase sigma factor [Gemmatimonadaceae bacterium]|nr:sigma-70 family RNA polymerase sigma factor [Gemmatimonadaceae bacterium]